MSRKRIVVKIGSSSLTNDFGEIDEQKMSDHVKAIAKLKQANHEVILVSSGAVASGFSSLGYSSRPVTVKGKQAAAAVGQSLLVQSYMEKFGQFDIMPAQLLLTRGDFTDRKRYQNAFQTITELLGRGILPIINENDTVVIDELTFGDNDMLSALVSGFIHADQLILLTDINGLYDDNPNTNPHAKKIDFLDGISNELLNSVDESGSKFGTGGMKSKIEAAKTALSLGVPVFIGLGEGDDKLLRIMNGKGDGTYIVDRSVAAINTKRQWIALHSDVDGKIYIDEGAEEAIIKNGKSLLPAGIIEIKGNFTKGDVVEVYGADGLLGKGEVNCSAEEIKDELTTRNEKLQKGKVIYSTEVIHRDRWIKI